MSAVIRPVTLVHRGAVEAHAMAFDAIHTLEGRRRVLAAWEPGARIELHGSVALVRWRTPRRVTASLAPGTPLVACTHRDATWLSAAPLDARERDALAARGARDGAAVLVRAGAAVVLPAKPDAVTDLAAWIDLGPIEVDSVTSLGVARVQAASVSSVARPGAVFAGTIAHEGASAMGRAMRVAIEHARASKPSEPEPVEERPFAQRFWARLADSMIALQRWRAARRTPPSDGPRVERLPVHIATTPSPPRVVITGPSWFERALERAAAWLRAKVPTPPPQVAAWIDAKYAAYLDALVRSLEMGDVWEALRRAIPLSSEKSDGSSSTPWWAPPAPRTALVVGGAKAPAGSAMPTSLFDRLKGLYLSVAQQLEAEGRLDEAAFVLAELLGDADAAIALYERHGRWARAAEVAEAARLPPARVVRQRALARDFEGALAYARRHGCHAEALALCNGADVEVLQGFRRAWARELADSGQYARAMDVLWPDEVLRPEALRWVDRVMALGGVPGAQAVLRLVSVAPASVDEAERWALALARDEGLLAVAARLHLAQALRSEVPSPERARLGRANLPALVRDAALARTALRRVDVRAVATASLAATFRADLPHWVAVQRTKLSDQSAGRPLSVSAHDAGTLPVLDVALAGDRLVVALGEAGVWILDSRGAVLHRCDAPCDALVLSTTHDRALAVADRGRHRTVHRVDLLTGEVQRWGDPPVTAFARSYDGARWIVAEGRELTVLDTLAAVPTVLRPAVRFEEPAVVRAIAAEGAVVGVVTVGASSEFWAYNAVSWVRVDRNGPAGDAKGERFGAVDSLGNRVLVVEAAGRWSVVASMNTRSTAVLVGDLGASRVSPPRVTAAVTSHHAAVAIADTAGTLVQLHSLPDGTLRRAWHLGGAARVALRLDASHLAVADSQGRAFAIELAEGRTIVDARV